MTTFLLSELVALVRSAGEILLGDGASHINEKGYGDFVTEADMTVQQTLIAALREKYPEADILSEESAEKPDTSRPVFILDPVDGTTNLIRGLRQSCISLGLVIEGKPRIGIVYNPFTGVLYTAEKGCGAFCNGKPIHVRDTAVLRDSLAAVGTCPYHRERRTGTLGLIEKVYDSCLDLRRFGSAALDLCAVAEGSYELFCEYQLRPWDYCAGALVLTEAGGRITDWKGNEPDYFADLHVCATNAKVHDETLRMLSDFAD